MHSIWIWIGAGPCVVSLHLIKRISSLHVNYLQCLNMYHQADMPVLKQIHRCTHKLTRARRHQGRRRTQVRRADDGRAPLRSVSIRHLSAGSLPRVSMALPCRRAASPQDNWDAGSARRCGNVGTRQELRASPVPPLISSTWKCSSVRELLFCLSSARVHSKGNAGELHLNWIKSLRPATLRS